MQMMFIAWQREATVRRALSRYRIKTTQRRAWNRGVEKKNKVKNMPITGNITFVTERGQ
jgi:hypothetical protein